MLPKGVIFELKIHRNAFAVGVSPLTPMAGLQRSARPATSFSGSYSQQWRDEEEVKRTEVEGRVPHIFLQFNHCLSRTQL